ncbi:MAG: tyrosine recombinase XerC [Oscillospiraceae bacterium]|nr:tyrosine recombinase XerC [Oscillospiraceae bacterium]
MTETKFHGAPGPLRDFLFYMLTIRGRSPRTVEGYYIDLRTFLRYLKVRGSAGTDLGGVCIADMDIGILRKVSLSDVYDFLNYTMTERENGAKARARKVSSLRTFFNYLTVKERLLEDNPLKHLELPSVKRALPKHLTLEESIELMAAVDTKFPRRDYCILTLFLNCGVRLSELVGINLNDIRLGEGTIKVLGKGSKERIVYLNDACVFAIEQQLEERAGIQGASEEKALLLSSRGRRISPRRVEQIVADCLRAAGLEGQGYSPHKLRHTAATLLYQHGQVDIRVLKEILGHANLSTTELYTHVSNKQIESAAHKSPLSGVKMKKEKS